jgi:hypothetical protein
LFISNQDVLKNGGPVIFTHRLMIQRFIRYAGNYICRTHPGWQGKPYPDTSKFGYLPLIMPVISIAPVAVAAIMAEAAVIIPPAA